MEKNLQSVKHFLARTKHVFFLGIYVILLSSCSTSRNFLTKRRIKKTTLAKDASAVKEKKVTIFIHGTLPPIAATLVRWFDLPLGLRPALCQSNKFIFSSIGYTLSQADQKMFPIEYFYLFGWSGSLSFKAREDAAKELYHSIKNLEGEKTIIAHSHGGNVALYLHKLAATDNNPNFVIERLVILATPIQEVTVNFAQASTFKKVISLYSQTDMIQILDPQGLYQETKEVVKEKSSILSKRKLPKFDNTAQVRVLFNKGNPSHIDFTWAPFMKKLPDLLALIESQWEKIAGKECAINIPRSHFLKPFFVKSIKTKLGTNKFVQINEPIIT